MKRWCNAAMSSMWWSNAYSKQRTFMQEPHYIHEVSWPEAASIVSRRADYSRNAPLVFRRVTDTVHIPCGILHEDNLHESDNEVTYSDNEATDDGYLSDVIGFSCMVEGANEMNDTHQVSTTDDTPMALVGTACTHCMHNRFWHIEDDKKQPEGYRSRPTEKDKRLLFWQRVSC